jgi:hypothetical protein
MFWPGFVCAAHMRNIPILLCSAELAQDSNSTQRYFSIISINYFILIFTLFFLFLKNINNTSCEFFTFLIRFIVAGDARYDQIIQKAEQITITTCYTTICTQKTSNIHSSSIWPADEKTPTACYNKII